MGLYPLVASRLIADQAMTGNITTPILTIPLQDNITYQAFWTGAPVGSFFVDVSVDYNAAAKNPGTWTTLPLAPIITAAGTPDDAIFELNQLGGSHVRLRYVFTSGTGVLNVWASGKGI